MLSLTQPSTFDRSTIARLWEDRAIVGPVGTWLIAIGAALTWAGVLGLPRLVGLDGSRVGHQLTETEGLIWSIGMTQMLTSLCLMALHLRHRRAKGRTRR